jgi:hypothetical protein
MMPDASGAVETGQNGRSGASSACETPPVVERDSKDPKTWTVLHFSQSNPSGEGQGDVAALLRRVADSIDGFGDITVQDITFHAEPTGDGEDDLSMTVYYVDQPRRR